MGRGRIGVACLAVLMAPWCVGRASAQTIADRPVATSVPALTFSEAAATTIASDATAQSVAPPVSADIFRGSSGSGTAALRSLYVSTATLQALDLHSTLTAFAHGGVEANPLMSGITSHTPVFIATKAAVATSMILAAHQLAGHHRFAAIATLVGINSAYAMIVAHNYHVAGSR